MEKRIIEQHVEHKDKSMGELIAERTNKLSAGQKTLRKKWLPEKHLPQPPKDFI